MDYISREDAIDCVLSQYCASSDETEKALGDAIEEIKALPAADVEERKTGKWILVREADETGNALYECSACHMSEIHSPIVEVKYCWNCGAKMEGNE